MSELEKLKLNDEFNAYYDYETVIRKEKILNMLAGLAEGKCFGISKKTNKEKLATEKIMKYTGLKKAKQLLLINKTK